MEGETNLTARVVRRLTARPERAFDAWLTPYMIGKWMFGPHLRDEEVISIKTDARVGGSFSFLVRRQDKEIDHVGEYLEIVRPRRIVFTWATRDDLPDTSRVTVEITPSGIGSEITLTHELQADWADYVNQTEAAWTRMLDALASMLD